MKLTQAQLDALYKVYQQWQNTTPHAIMPDDFEIIEGDDQNYYIGVWVGGPTPLSRERGNGMYLGIESDGYIHS